MSGEKVDSQFIPQWQQAFDKRQRLFPEKLKSPLESLRLLHKESDPLRMDKVGPTLVMGWWNHKAPTPQDLASLEPFLKTCGAKHWYMRWRPPKNIQAQSTLVWDSPEPCPETWMFHENGVWFEARKAQGDAFGLFLDQRENRQWLRQNAQGKKVLNLFSFTCGFSLFAALGGAEAVVSVDLSKKYLEWGKVNFQANNLDPLQFGFSAMDSLAYLKWAQKKGQRFDVVVCDPPSFSRNGKAVFKIDKDFPSLVEACMRVLAPGGTLLFSSNYEKWSVPQWSKKLGDLGYHQCHFLPPQDDFEGPQGDPVQKSFLIHR